MQNAFYTKMFQTQPELRGILVALEEERRKLATKREKLSKFHAKLVGEKSSLSEERRTVLEAVSKLGWAEKKFAGKMKEFEEITSVSRKMVFLRLHF
jgi:predicted transcriptional regulator